MKYEPIKYEYYINKQDDRRVFNNNTQINLFIMIFCDVTIVIYFENCVE